MTYHTHTDNTYNILCVQEPSGHSVLWSQLQAGSIPGFRVFKHILVPGVSTTHTLLHFLHTHRVDAIFAGFPAFHPIGGLSATIINDPAFNANVKVIALCSRGVNFIDLETLALYPGIKLVNYDDDDDDNDNGGQVGNDVADCAMWHVMDGFRKFTLFNNVSREMGHTIKARQLIRNNTDQSFAFGHQLGKSSNGGFVLSPRGKNVLVLGMGSIGKQIAFKLQYGLGMKIHYHKRSPLFPPNANVGDDRWTFHDKESLPLALPQMDVIVVALPGNDHTYHMIDAQFLSHCKKTDLIMVNVGRATVFDMDAIEHSLKSNQLRHLGMDVFTNEPCIDQCLLSSNHDNYTNQISLTPHIGSGTKEVFDITTDYALKKIISSLRDT